MAYEKALKELDAATARYRRWEDAQQGAIAAVVAALRAGAPPTVVAEHSPFTATYVRKVARQHGIPPAPAGMKPRKTTT